MPNVTLVLFLLRFNLTPGAILKLFLKRSPIVFHSFFSIYHISVVS
nr:MAG TPA: hypothetical protein [Caudoviricetes sp.]